MITTKDILCQIIKAELWQKRLKSGLFLSTEQYQSLMTLATEQTVSGMVGSVLIQNNVKVGKYDVANLYTTMSDIKHRNEDMDAWLAELARALNEAQVGYVVVKGQTIAPYYPNPETRISGDIDMYLDMNDYPRFREMMKNRFDIEVPEFGRGKHVGVEFRDTELEVHGRLTDIYRRKGARYWEDVYGKAFSSCRKLNIGGEEVSVLNPTLNALYVFVHLFYHLLILGVSLRQFCDWAMVLHHSYSDDHNKIDKAELKKHLDELGLYDAYCAFGTVLVDVLGLDEKEFLFELTDFHRGYTHLILDDIMAKGNFGMYNRRSHTAGWGHSLETARTTFAHLRRYYRLAPKEIRAFLPKQIWESVRLNMGRMKK